MSPEPIASGMRFRIDVAPDWAALAPHMQERAEQCGMPWPSGLKPHQVPRVYSARVGGTQDASARLQYQVTLWEPPHETPLPQGHTDWSSLDLSFGVVKRRFTMPRTELAKGALAPLAVHLDAQGLFLPTHANIPAQRLVALPLPALIDVFYRVAVGALTLQSAGLDHIVNKYVPIPPLEHFSISRWRGDATHRLSTSGLRLEVLIDTPQIG